MATSSRYRQYKPISFAENFSDEEMVRDWTLSKADKKEVGRYRKNARLYIAIQLCAVRLYGRFIQRVSDLSLRIINYLNAQLGLPTNLFVNVNTRKATNSIYRQNMLDYLGFQKFNEETEKQLKDWLLQKVKQAQLPDELFILAQQYLLANRVILPGASVLDKLVTHICSEAHLTVFDRIYQRLPDAIIQSIENVLQLPQGEQRTFFFKLKEYPPTASITSLKDYLNKYNKLMELGIDQLKEQLVEPSFQQYLYELTKKYNATDIKRFNTHKRYALMICFLLESTCPIVSFPISP